MCAHPQRETICLTESVRTGMWTRSAELKASGGLLTGELSPWIRAARRRAALRNLRGRGSFSGHGAGISEGSGLRGRSDWSQRLLAVQQSLLGPAQPFCGVSSPAQMPEIGPKTPDRVRLHSRNVNTPRPPVGDNRVMSARPGLLS
ncbi:hypothetical protein GN956_G9169 [Arapaima gigas]